MARNLAERETPRRSLPQKTFRRETTMPRQDTDRPERVITTRIQRPEGSAEELSRILGLANQVGQNILGDIKDTQDKKAGADAVLDFEAGTRDDKRFSKSYAYRDAYQREGAKKLSLDIGQEVTQAVNERLNDDENPATLDDINELIEGIYAAHIKDENGKLLDFGTPEAKVILGNSLREIKAGILPDVVKAIKSQTDARLLGTIAHNFVAEIDRGMPIGATPTETPVDPLAPLPEGDAPATATPPKRTVSIGKPTGKLPVQGPVTSTFLQHERRGSAGVDLDGRLGDPIVAPAGGEVISAGFTKKSGNFVKIDHGNGVISSYAHLQKADVKVGDIVRPGQTFATMGNTGHVSHGTGDGSHLHYRVRVNGKDVDPLSYRYADNSGSWEQGPDLVGEGPELAGGDTKPAMRRTPVDFEELMHRIPPSVDKGDAKAFFLQTLVNTANERGDPSLLNGLEDSLRKDGTPSFSPKEIASILSAREQISEKVRIKADQAERERYETNEETVMEALLSDNPPSDEWISQAALDDKIRDSWAFSFIHAREAERRQEARIQTAEAKEAAREAEADIDVTVSSLIAARSTGDLHGVSAESDKELFDSGALGTGKKAAARLRSLRAAARQGEQLLQSKPGYAGYAALIKRQLDPPNSGGGGSLLQKRFGQSGGGGDKVAYAQAIAHFRDKVGEGASAEEAYHSAMQRYGQKAGKTSDRRTLLQQRRDALLARQNAGR